MKRVESAARKQGIYLIMHEAISNVRHGGCGEEGGGRRTIDGQTVHGQPVGPFPWTAHSCKIPDVTGPV